ncbi:energy transducer TonB [Flavobacterium reichenbachii]|uniref:energy transducer TonB n=1 Tax=Flavobacterium reichenbachii TaxID=362418 RepID=UPI00068CE73C|nr:energy transducer TonB [Flavobacterium reichenbachii]OXB18453.1 hypothetical protein B0A68_00055 [Flavobacterium reichenbachii]
MTKPIHKITVPEPCHEDWDKMMPKDNGRFCMSCSKTIVDFTSMLPEEIQHFLIQNQTERICGRFRKSQLETINIEIPSQIMYSQTNYRKMFLLVLFIAMGTTLFSQNKEGNKQNINEIEVVEDSVANKSVQKPNENLKQTAPPPVPPKTISQKNENRTVTGNFKVEDSIHKSIDYDAVFEPSSLHITPVPEDGMKNLYNFIYANYVIPDGAEEYTGKVIISFIIEKDGSLSTFKIKKDFGFGTGMEAIRVLKRSPKWIPGKLNDRIVRSSYMLPISIKKIK